MSGEKAQAVQPTMPLGMRLRLLAVAWGVAIIGMAVILRGVSEMAPLFPTFSPVGFLVLIVLSHDSDSLGDYLYYLAALTGWIYYLWLTVWAWRSPGASKFSWIYVALCLSLLLNLGSCEVAKHMASSFGQAPATIKLADSH